MDFFTIVSFGLAIAALLLSFFFGILSWLFYKQSANSTEQMMRIVSSIEATVAGVQANITGIIDKAVASWIGSTNIDEINTQSIDDKFKEIESSVKKEDHGSNDIIISQLAELKQQADALFKDIREKQMRSLLLPTLGQQKAEIIKVTQENTISNKDQATGIMRIYISKPTRLATATVHFSPPFSCTPKVTANLISSPYKSKDSISAKPGTPNKLGFNFHLNAKDLLEVGEYIVEYTAVMDPGANNCAYDNK